MTAELTPEAGPSPEGATAVYDGRVRFFRALAYPFFDKPWHWLLNLTLITLLQYVPFVGLLVIQGWSLEVSRRVRAGDPNPLPRWATFWDYLKGWWGCLVGGLVLWLIWVVVYEIPGILLTVILLVKFAWEMWHTGYGWYQSYQNGQPMPEFTTEMAFTWGTNYLVGFLVEKAIVLSISLALIVIGHVMYCGGMVRYLNGGSWWAFFQPLKNLWLVLCHWKTFSVMLFYWVVLQTVLWLISLMLTSFGIGAFIVPVMIPIGFWFVGHLYGQVALKVAAEG